MPSAQPIHVRLPHLATAPKPRSLATAAPGSGDQVLSTFGWDTAFAVNVPEVNAAIVSSGATPKSFSFTDPSGTITIQGTFGPWQLGADGSGELVHMTLPVATGTISVSGKTTVLDGSIALIELELRAIPQIPDPTTGATPNHIVVKSTTVDPKEPAVSVLTFTLPASLVSPDPAAAPLAQYALGAWLNANLIDFAYVFSVVNLNRKADVGSFQWLQPTFTSYAFARGPTLDTCSLGVLCMTSGRSPAQLAQQLHPDAAPGGGHAGFLIAHERVLEEILLPGMPRAFVNASASDFGMSADGTKIVNLNPVATKPVDSGGSTYYPKVVNLTVSATGGVIEIDMAIHVSISSVLGAYAVINVTTFHNLVLATRPDGTQTLTFATARPTITDHHMETTADGAELQILIEILAAILALVLTIVTEGAFLLVGILIVGLLVGLMEAIPAQIADVVGQKISNDSPSIDPLVAEATAPVAWTDAKDFSLTDLRLADCLQLIGDARFAH